LIEDTLDPLYKYKPLVATLVSIRHLKGTISMIKIHHGSGVETALSEIIEEMTLVRPPYDDLKTDKVKDLVEVCSQVWPQNNPCVLVGPLDGADPSTLDILLKTIEEPLEGSPYLILWAHDYGSVPATIRSRCSEKYHFQPSGRHALYSLAERLLKAHKEDNLLNVCRALSEVPKEETRGILEAFLEVVVEKGEWEVYTEEFKELLKRKTMSVTALYGFFLGE
jgi:hypothetical protein